MHDQTDMAHARMRGRQNEYGNLEDDTYPGLRAIRQLRASPKIIRAFPWGDILHPVNHAAIVRHTNHKE